MRRRTKSAAPAVTRPAVSPASGGGSLPLPELGKVVSVGFEDVGRSWRTRVEVSAGSSLVLVAPTRTMGEAIIPDVGRDVLVGWPEEDGYYEGECSFAAAGVDTVVTWTLLVHRVQRVQRRSAFRIDTSGTIVITVRGRELEARLRNLSEGGLCCVLPAPAAPSEGSAIQVVAEFEGLGHFACEATVVRVKPASEQGQAEVAAAFTGLDEPRREELRQFVFAEQLRRRRTLSSR